jgi:hypothetical protein
MACAPRTRKHPRTSRARRVPPARAWPAARLLLAATLAGGPSTATGQTPDWLFPPRDLLPHLLAAPREPVVKGMLMYADPDPTAYGPGFSGEVAIAGTVPVLRLAGASNALVLGLEGAAFAHFSLEVVTRELVNTDWLFAVPLVWRRGRHWLRVRYYHTSSHLGDEYQRRFGPSSVNFARDGAELTVYVRPGSPAGGGAPSGPRTTSGAGIGLYAGVLWSPNSHPEEGTVWRGRAGVELDPYHGGLWRPFGALDVELEDGSHQGARWTGQAGIWMPRVQGRPLRLALEAATGPSAMGQFYRRETGRVGLGLFWNP